MIGKRERGLGWSWRTSSESTDPKDHRRSSRRHRAVAETIPPARVAQRYGAFDIDSMPPAATTALAPALIERMRVDHGEQARRADFVDGVGGHGLCETRFEEHLPCRILTDAGLQHLAEADVFDFGWIDLRTLDGGREATAPSVVARAERALPRACRTACAPSPARRSSS